MALVHHNTAKRAKAHGVQLDVDADGETVVAIFKNAVLARGPNARLVLDTALGEINGKVPGPRKPSQPKPAKAKKPAKAAKPVEFDEDEDGLVTFGLVGDDEDGEAEGDDEADELPESKSVIKRKYRQRYRPTHYTCGDSLAQELAEYLTYKDEDGKPRTDTDKLKAFAKANDVWVQSYASLNPGMQRMNVRNRLAAKIKKGYEVSWV